MSLESERNCVLDRLDKADLMGIRPVVAGSAAMILHGIELGRQPGDIDAFVTTAQWFDLYSAQLHVDAYETGDQQGVVGYLRWGNEFDVFIPDPENKRRRQDPPYLIEKSDPDFPMHIFFAWRYRPENNWDIAAMMRDAMDIDGVLVAPLDTVYQQKMQARRPKDLRDMALILEHEQERVDALKSVLPTTMRDLV